MSDFRHFNIGEKVLYVEGINERDFSIQKGRIIGFNTKHNHDGKTISLMYRIRADVGIQFNEFRDFDLVSEYVYGLDQYEDIKKYIKNENKDLIKINKGKIKSLSNLVKGLKKLNIPNIVSDKNNINLEVCEKCGVGFNKYNFDGSYFYYSLDTIETHANRLCLDSLIGIGRLTAAEFRFYDEEKSVYYEGEFDHYVELSSIDENTTEFKESSVDYDKKYLMSYIFYYQSHKKVFTSLREAVNSLIADLEIEINKRKGKLKNAEESPT